MAVPALPLESHTIRSTSRAFAAATSTAAPRSLNDRVGDASSSFPVMPPSRSTSGVPPSPREIVAAATGSENGSTSW
jgi:hypothetical protein